MGFNVSALANYTEQNAALLVTSSVLGAKTATLIKSAGNVMVGVKSSETINIIFNYVSNSKTIIMNL